jgi:hypothetical protein
MSEKSTHVNVLAISNNIEQKNKKTKTFYNPLYSNHLNPTHQQIHPFACRIQINYHKSLASK